MKDSGYAKDRNIREPVFIQNVGGEHGGEITK